MISQPFEKMPSIPRPQEIIDNAFGRAIKTQTAKGGPSPLIRTRRLEERRIKTISHVIAGATKGIVDTTPRLNELHPFYVEIVGTVVGIDGYKQNLAKVAVCHRIVRRLTGQYVRQARRAETVAQAIATRRAFMGRTASLVRGLAEPLEFLRRARDKLSRLPTADPSTTTVVVAGCPNAGKSTIVSKLSSAKPEIAEYPFTTKEIVVGHTKLDHTRVQIIDTPGLLDRPLQDRNPLELKAIAALQHLATIAVFVFDVSNSAAYPLDRQFALCEEIQRSFVDLPMIFAANKVDIAPPEVMKELRERLTHPVVETAAVRGAGVDVLRASLRSAIHSHSRSRNEL